jgi:phosphatidylserine/phosphatidylglycerophosphate/cardiolipin synthase-like enzyme
VAKVSSATWWNHAKIVVADGKVAMVGGHNYWTGAYFGSDPVEDLSMVVYGKAAMVAQEFANWIWASQIGGDGAQDPYDPQSAQNLPGGSMRVIGGGSPGGVRGLISQPSDAGLYAMIASAHKTVMLSQQGLDARVIDKLPSGITSWRGIEEQLLDSIKQALFNGADVYIVLSNFGGDYGPGISAADTAAAIRDYVAANGGGDQTTQALCQRLHVAHLRFSDLDTWPDGGSISNHAKFVMVDDTTFYIGSQNLYPGGLADHVIPGLMEFGFFVDDESAAAQVRAEYWDNLWSESSRVAVSGSDAPSCQL